MTEVCVFVFLPRYVLHSAVMLW